MSRKIGAGLVLQASPLDHEFALQRDLLSNHSRFLWLLRLNAPGSWPQRSCLLVDGFDKRTGSKSRRAFPQLQAVLVVGHMVAPPHEFVPCQTTKVGASLVGSFRSAFEIERVRCRRRFHGSLQLPSLAVGIAVVPLDSEESSGLANSALVSECIQTNHILPTARVVIFEPEKSVLLLQNPPISRR
jgi:hypothetical protein